MNKLLSITARLNEISATASPELQAMLKKEIGLLKEAKPKALKVVRSGKGINGESVTVLYSISWVADTRMKAVLAEHGYDAMVSKDVEVASGVKTIPLEGGKKRGKAEVIFIPRGAMLVTVWRPLGDMLG